ncbi:MAG: hypothetical protein J7513_03085 [Solirubrobacteraceae bacterium]|nr:hypothetical protein [Solirubrobacteraceae bacterium]
MGTWTESTSNLFRVRFDDDSRTEVEELVHVLETVAARLEAHGLVLPPHPTVVVHPTAFSLALAQPAYVAALALTETHGRKYMASWASGSTLHLIAPDRLARGTEGHISLRDAMDRAPAAGLAHLAIGHANPALSLQKALRRRDWFWLAWGAGQTLVGQVPMLASVIALRRKERRAIHLPPPMRDAVVMGGSLVELVLRDRGLTALVHLLRDPLPPSADGWIGRALPGLGSTERDVRWRMLLDDLDRARAVVLQEATAKAAAEAEARRAEEQRMAQAMAEVRAAQEEAQRAAEEAELDAAAERAAARSARRRRERGGD